MLIVIIIGFVIGIISALYGASGMLLLSILNLLIYKDIWISTFIMAIIVFHVASKYKVKDNLYYKTAVDT